ncbi:hypothetical protein H0H81_002399, partial [Sphagnurus paluster]
EPLKPNVLGANHSITLAKSLDTMHAETHQHQLIVREKMIADTGTDKAHPRHISAATGELASQVHILVSETCHVIILYSTAYHYLSRATQH